MQSHATDLMCVSGILLSPRLLVKDPRLSRNGTAGYDSDRAGVAACRTLLSSAEQLPVISTWTRHGPDMLPEATMLA